MTGNVKHRVENAMAEVCGMLIKRDKLEQLLSGMEMFDVAKIPAEFIKDGKIDCLRFLYSDKFNPSIHLLESTPGRVALYMSAIAQSFDNDDGSKFPYTSLDYRVASNELREAVILWVAGTEVECQYMQEDLPQITALKQKVVEADELGDAAKLIEARQSVKAMEKSSEVIMHAQALNDKIMPVSILLRNISMAYQKSTAKAAGVSKPEIPQALQLEIIDHANKLLNDMHKWRQSFVAQSFFGKQITGDKMANKVDKITLLCRVLELNNLTDAKTYIDTAKKEMPNAFDGSTQKIIDKIAAAPEKMATPAAAPRHRN